MWTGFIAFSAGVILAASSTVVAQTGPTFPTTSPVPVIGEGASGSGSPVDPAKGRADPEKGRATVKDGMDIVLPGTDPAAGR